MNTSTSSPHTNRGGWLIAFGIMTVIMFGEMTVALLGFWGKSAPMWCLVVYVISFLVYLVTIFGYIGESVSEHGADF